MSSLTCDRMELQRDRTEIANKTLAPLYITIGPPCGGKSDAITRQARRDGYVLPENDHHCDGNIGEENVVELQEQADGLYQRVPLAAFLFPNSTKYLDSKLGDETVLQSGMTVRERLLYPSPPPLDETDLELRHVILRVAGRMTAEDFAERIRQQQLSMVSSNCPLYIRRRREKIADDLVRAVEAVSVQAVGEVLMHVHLAESNGRNATSQARPGVVLSPFAEDGEDLPYSDSNDSHDEPVEHSKNDGEYIMEPTASAHLLSAKSLIRTPHVDIFVANALFGGGISQAERRLEQLLGNKDQFADHPISWGNTNTRISEYVPALKAAEIAGRPVQFVVWGGDMMPKVSRTELLRRNVEKFRRTGRYVPAGAIGAALGRVEKLLREARKESKRIQASQDSGLDESVLLGSALASLAGFRMDNDGCVVQIGEPRRFGRKEKGSNR